MYVYLWLIHAEVWQKTRKFSKAIILQLKNKLILKRILRPGLENGFLDMTPKAQSTKEKIDWMDLSSVQFSQSIVSDSLQPHGLQHARPPGLSPTPGAGSNSCWVSDAIQPSHPLSPPSVFNLSQHQSFPMSQFFTSVGQSIGISASASVLPMNT